MYTIKAFVNGKEYTIHNPRVKALAVGDPYFEIGDNVNGQAEFTVYPTHPYYKYVQKLTTDIIFYNDGVEEFAGRVLYDDEDFRGSKKVFIEGELAFFCDSIQRPKVYHNTSVEDYLADIISIHNSQVEERKQFTLGRVSVTDPNDSLYRYSNWEDTRTILKDRLTDRLGGHLVIRKENGIRFLDYLNDDEYYRANSQTIRFGKNLLDYSRNMDATDLVTCVIPLGAKLDESSIEGLEERLTIKDVNGGVDYVTDDNAVATYGKIYKTVTWDDVTVPENLMRKGKEYLKSVQFEKMVLECKAIDMSLTDAEIEQLNVGDSVHCISEPNGLDSWFPLSKKKVYISDFKKNTVTLGTETENVSYTSSQRQETASMEQEIKSMPSKQELLQKALQEATDLINTYTQNGHAIHTPNEFIVSDTPGVEDAKMIWRWGLGGLAHYSNGYDGPADGIALTMDGKINGKMLIAGSIMAESIDVGYRNSVESQISEAETAAKEYADSKVRVAKETVETSITNLENRINLSVASVKETVLRKNYVTGGEQDALNLDNFTVSGNYANVEAAEFMNMNCIKLTFTATGVVYLNQLLETLPEGEYTIAVTAAFPSGSTATVYRPTYIAYGFSNNRSTEYFSSYNADEFHTFKKTVSITGASKTVSIGIYGTAGKVCYITNIRCLRDIQELLNDLQSEFTVGIGEVSARVSDIYENVQHDYCINGNFSDADDYFSGWYLYNSTYTTHETFNDVSCAKIVNTESTRYYIRQTIKNQKTGPFRVRFKAACASGYESTARIRIFFGGVYKYTAAGELTTEFQTFQFDFDEVTVANWYCYFYNYVLSTTVYITDIEILGYMSAYSEAQFTVLQNSITAEVTRASGAESTLKAAIQVNADSISNRVEKGEFGTYITQNYSYVRMAWNKYTKYIQFENAALNIYDSSDTLLMSLNYTGSWFYYSGTTIGKIGTNAFANYPDYRGLCFDLQYTGDYMAWAAQTSSTGAYYTKLAWYRDDTINNAGFNFSDYVYVYGYLRFNANAGFYNYSGGGIKLWSDATISIGSSSDSCCQFTGTAFTIWNNRSIDFYSTLNLHGWGYTNDSDIRLKKNIAPTKVKGLEVVNGIDLKEFDWIETDEHQAIGLIAQQILPFASELIRKDEKTGCLRLKTDQLVYYCIKAIQELCESLGMRHPAAIYNEPYSSTEKQAFVKKVSRKTEMLEDEHYNLPSIALPREIKKKKG